MFNVGTRPIPPTFVDDTMLTLMAFGLSAGSSRTERSPFESKSFAGK